MTNETILQNKGLVVSIARRYQGRGLDLEDMVQEGYIGLLEAQKRYKDNMGAKFSTYASYWIKQSIIRAIELTGSLVRCPSGNQEALPINASNYDINGLAISNDLQHGCIIGTIRSIIGNDVDTGMYVEYYANGLSYRDIAKAYGINYQSVKNKLDILHELVVCKLKKRGATI